MKTEAERRAELATMAQIQPNEFDVTFIVAKGGSSNFAGHIKSQIRQEKIDSIIAHEKTKGLISD